MLLIFNILMIWGVYAATRSDAIFDLEKFKLNEFNEKWIARPLYNCPYCMASFWGSIGFFVFHPETDLGIYFLPFWILSIAGSNYLILLFLTNE